MQFPDSKIVTVPVQLPNYFSMDIKSVYGKLVSNAFFQRPDTRDFLLPVIEQLTSKCMEHEELATEDVIFHFSDRDISVKENLAKNNQLIGASRQVNEFMFGYEPEIYCAFDVLTPADAVIFDVGSNWGPITLQAAMRPGFEGKVFSFEPQKNAFDMLVNFVDRLSLQNCVYPFNLALSNMEGQAFMSNDLWSGNKHVVSSSDVDAETCRMVRLDDFASDIPNLIKIDVEGFENNVIQGASNIIKNHLPYLIFEDFLDSTKDHFYFLDDIGYKFYCLGWSNPFTGSFCEKPIATWPVQLLAFKEFSIESRSILENRINVFASPQEIC